jgi:hypothetical protein
MWGLIRCREFVGPNCRGWRDGEGRRGRVVNDDNFADVSFVVEFLYFVIFDEYLLSTFSFAKRRRRGSGSSIDGIVAWRLLMITVKHLERLDGCLHFEGR